MHVRYVVKCLTDRTPVLSESWVCFLIRKMGLNSCLHHRLFWGSSEMMPGGYTVWVLSGLIKFPNNQLVKCELYPGPLALVSSDPSHNHCLPMNCCQRLRSVYTGSGLPQRHCQSYILKELQVQEQFQSLSVERCWLCRICRSWNHYSYGKHQSGTTNSDDRDSSTGTRPLWFSGLKPRHIHFTN